MAAAPDVEVFLIDSPFPPVGAGEMGIPPVAPALANAIFAATGKRLRRLPLGGQVKT
jgi:isoquinoline 1-oxidoreductase beta subunit